ncbi:MAG: SigE family RNA polymerase sigma factor [Acidimicrobiales bacterium]|jgi:RNA polymerase sigma-70 factor (ECF subfamily)
MGVEEATQVEGRFEQIYRDSYPRLVGQLSVVTTSRAEAEEVVQEAFARLWGRWSHVRDYENIEAWVRRVALNVATSRWRRSRRNEQLFDVMPAHDDPAGSDVVVLMALRRVPIKQRSALFLHHIVGLSVDEVANEMSTKPGTVKSWLSRGRAELDNYFRDKESDIHD